MRINSIVIKLGLVFLLLFMVIIFPLGFSMNKIFSSFFISEEEKRLETLSTRYASLITDLDDDQILTMFVTLADLTGHELFIVNENGRVMVNSGLPSVQVGTMLSMNLLAPMKNPGFVRMEFQDQITEKRYLSIGAPIIKDDDFIGGVYVLSPMDGIYESTNRVKSLVFLAGIGTIFLALGFIFFFTKKLTSPLLQIEKATRNIAHGDLKTRVNVSSNDEIGSLGEAINYLATELGQYQTNRREFFANISHELRTPLTYLGGYIKAIRQGLYQSEEEKEQYLLIVEKETKRMTQLVNDLFELSKMEEGKLEFHFENIDLHEVIQNAIEKSEIKAKEKGLELRVDGNSEFPIVCLDGFRTEQILTNLIENAIRYTNEGFITVRSAVKNNRIDLFVHDTGLGIPKEELPFLFERFYRVEKSRSRQTGGTGLGLSIVKRLVELQNGEIHVESEVGKGTCFILSFPLDERRER